MTSQKRIMKILVMVILVVFLLSSALVSVMYFADMKAKVNENPTTGDVAEDVLSGSIASGDVLSGN